VVLTAEACGWNDDLVRQHLERLRRGLRRPDGMLATMFRGRQCIDETPLVADLGDTAPFLAALGHPDEAIDLARRCRPFLRDGLFTSGNVVRLFDNHDFLLGLLEIHSATRDEGALEMAEQGMRTLVREFEVRGLLIDRVVDGRRPWLASANPFNGGYIELAVDLHARTGDAVHLAAARRWADAWVRTPGFRARGVFSRFNTPALPWVGEARSRVSRHGAARLFKDNTNLAWSLLRLHAVDRDRADHLRRFLRGFRAVFHRDGIVRLTDARPRSAFDLSASTFSIDLLCDLAAAGIDRPETLALARGIADTCLAQRWPNGLFPSDHRGDRDHLDLMTDLGVALHKLSESTGDPAYARVGGRSRGRPHHRQVSVPHAEVAPRGSRRRVHRR
jgi:hypothetical protein